MSNKLFLGIEIGSAFSSKGKAGFKDAKKQAVELGKTYRQTNKELNASKKFVQTRDQLSKLRKEYERSGRSDKKLSGQIKRTENAYEKARQGVAQYGIELDKVDKNTAKLINRQKKQETQLRKLRAEGDKSKKSFSLGGALRKGAKIGGAVLGSGVAIGGSAFAFTNNFAGKADKTAKTADLLGYSVEGLQADRYAAQRAGLDESQYDNTARRVIRRIADAARGQGEGVKALEALGLDAEYLAELAPEKQMLELADAIKAVEDEGERMAIFARLGDTEGVPLVNLLKGGREELIKLRQEAKETGGILSEKDARNAEAYQDAMLNATFAANGLKNILGTALLPVMKDLGMEMTAFSKEYGNEIRALGTIVSSVVSLIGKTIKAAFAVPVRIAQTFGTAAGVLATGDVTGVPDALSDIWGDLFSDDKKAPSSSSTQVKNISNAQSSGNRLIELNAPISITVGPDQSVQDAGLEVEKALLRVKQKAEQQQRGALTDGFAPA